MLDTHDTLRSLLRVTLALGLTLLPGVVSAEAPEEPPTDEPRSTETQESQSADGEERTAETEARESQENEQPASAAAEDRRDARIARSPKQFSWAEVSPRPHVWTGEPISLSLRDADLVEVLRSFGKMTDTNLIIDPSVEGKVTVELKNVPWDQALYVILKSNGLGMEISGNVWSMKPTEKLYKDD